MSDDLKKILIVDDESHVTEPFGRMLERRLAAKVTAADNGRDAINLAKEISFDLILLDLAIGGVDGWHVMEEIRKFDTNVKIVVVTGKPQFSPEEQGIIDDKTSGAFHKPIQINEITKKIIELFGENISITPVCLKDDGLKVKPEIEDVVHKLNGLHGRLSIVCQEYFYAFEHGFYKDRTPEEHIERLQIILKDVMDAVNSSKSLIKDIQRL